MVASVLAGWGALVWALIAVSSTIPQLEAKGMSRQLPLAVLMLVLLALVAAPVQAADEYSMDTMHSGVNFKISHLGLSWVHGRFNDFSGSFTLDADDPTKSSFTMTIQAASIDTNNKNRDKHLNSPDFFNAKQFPTIKFESTAVKAIKDGYEVTGDMTMHGVTKSITFSLTGGKTVEFPKGVKRTGYSSELVLKRSDFGMNKFAEALGDEVHVSVSFEGTKK
jgi:polyisoprenoid-binding protein YceI